MLLQAKYKEDFINYFDHLGSAVLAASAPNLVCAPGLRRENLNAEHALPSSSQNAGVTGTALAMNVKHSTIWATVRNVNSIPATPSTI